jgi:hypothetical protein
MSKRMLNVLPADAEAAIMPNLELLDAAYLDAAASELPQCGASSTADPITITS